MLEDMVYMIAGIIPLVSGAAVARRSGWLAGVAVGVALFIAVVVILVVAGYGY